jgi:hypothetical protein
MNFNIGVNTLHDKSREAWASCIGSIESWSKLRVQFTTIQHINTNRIAKEASKH